MTSPAEKAAANAVAEAHRREWARVLAAVVRTAGDLDLAEEATQEAYIASLRTWPRDGVPANPASWLTTAARRKALDQLRRERNLRRKLPLLVIPGETPEGPYDPEAGEAETSGGAEIRGEATVPDERLRLIFTCCHPALSLEARVALTLRMVCGLATAEIARLFLVPLPTMAARLTRAKKKIRAAGIPYHAPVGHELDLRLPGVLAVVYLLLTEGHTATRGADLMRPDLVTHAIELARTLIELMPDNREVGGLLALCLLTEARRPARVDRSGGLVPLEDQDRSRWDRQLIDEGIDLVERSLRHGRGPAETYVLQAAIAAVHAEAASYQDTDWKQLLALHDRLLAVHPSPVVALGRAVALAMVSGPEAGLAAVSELAADPHMSAYHLVPAVRADLLRRLGRTDEAEIEYKTAARLTDNDAERDFLRRRSHEMGAGPTG